MKNIIKLVGIYFIAGVACKAGEQLWDSVLKDKTCTMMSKLKTTFEKKES